MFGVFTQEIVVYIAQRSYWIKYRHKRLLYYGGIVDNFFFSYV